MSIVWQIVTFAVVIGIGLVVAYGLIRPFTHIHHDHREVVHPPWLEDFDSGPERR